MRAFGWPCLLRGGRPGGSKRPTPRGRKKKPKVVQLVKVSRLSGSSSHDCHAARRNTALLSRSLNEPSVSLRVAASTSQALASSRMSTLLHLAWSHSSNWLDRLVRERWRDQEQQPCGRGATRRRFAGERALPASAVLQRPVLGKVNWQPPRKRNPARSALHPATMQAPLR